MNLATSAMTIAEALELADLAERSRQGKKPKTAGLVMRTLAAEARRLAAMRSAALDHIAMRSTSTVHFQTFCDELDDILEEP